MLNYSFSPLGTNFPRPLTPAEDRSYSRFKKSWPQILDDLERETFLIDAREGSIVIRTFHEAYDIRNDGRLCGDAREPKHPGVVIAFDVPSPDGDRWVPMAFECDQFTTWRANVQAIAGALEALRKVDRYGVSSRGKTNAHYEGYKALPSAEGKLTTIEEHAAFIATYSGVSRHEILDNDTTRKIAYRKAASKLHPDQPNGSHELFARLIDANNAIEAQKPNTHQGPI